LANNSKKNSISVDIISFGEPNTQHNEEKLQALLNATNNTDDTGKDNSHYVPVPSGNLVEALTQMTGGTQGAALASMDLDPEFAWAVELSKQAYEQEHKSLQPDVEMKDASSTPSTTSTTPVAPTATTGSSSASTVGTDNLNPSTLSSLGIQVDEDDTDLLAAIQMSLQSGDTDLIKALQLSTATAKEDQQKETKKETNPKTEEHSKATAPASSNTTSNTSNDQKIEDANLDLSDIDDNSIQSVLLGLPVDKDDPDFQKLLQSFKKEDKDKI